MKHDGKPELAFAFGPFMFDPRQRRLSRADTALALGSRARHLLLLLLNRAGETVPKRELLSQVWADTLVEEGTLRVHIAALRKALGDGEDGGPRYVENVTGRGYRFIAPVTRVRPEAVLSTKSAALIQTQEHPLPMALTHMLGRGQVVSSLIAGLPQQRLITIVGPGGIGKTTVAIAVAEGLRKAYADGVRHIDLQSISDPGLLCTSIASVLGLATPSADLHASLAAYGRSEHLLLVLDNCDHVIGAAAHLVERLLAGAPNIHIMATSREPLRARGECVLRLKPLELPEPDARLTASEALTFSAIQLFVEHARASLHTFELIDEDACTVAEICRRLDGLPLAIELAAPRVDLFGVRGLATRLDDYLSLLTQGRRTAAPRHQTLRATLDWSYEILSPALQQALCRLAVFAGGFAASSAVAVVADAATQASEVVDILANLAAKSLLTVEAAGESVCYRLLNSSRAYALEKLESTAESATIRRRHAQLCRRWAEEASQDGAGRDAWPDGWRRRLEDLRAALDWCFSQQGDPMLGFELTACSAALWFRLSCHSEYRIRLERALRMLPDAEDDNTLLELRLHAALGEALVYTHGAREEVRAANQTLGREESGAGSLAACKGPVPGPHRL